MLPKTKKIIAVCVGVPLLGFAVVGIKVQYDYWSWQRKTTAFEDALKKPFQEDNYGGKTPEETWAMFLDALKKDNVDLAVKYFFAYNRDKQLEKFRIGKELGRYEEAKDFYLKGPLVKDEILGEQAFYHIPNPLLKEKLIEAYPINFQFNKYTGVWKLMSI